MKPLFKLFVILYMVFEPIKINAQTFENLFNPLDTPLQFSAPFGSLRENHFHSGMDLRTNEKEGLPVYAIEDGWISRIKIQSIGYGKAIYISHPSGYTSVYGHLKSYYSLLADYITNVQYLNKQFEIDHFPAKGKLFVKKGQIIGYSGNSGTSSGPHLHFEIRDSKSEEIINPLLFGFKVQDTLFPYISSVVLYNLNNNRPIIIKRIQINNSKKSSEIILNDTFIVNNGLVGIGVECYDKLTDPKKDYSIYGINLSVVNNNFFKFMLNRFSFDKTRNINAHIDYPIWKRENIRFHKLFIDDGNRIHLYPFVKNKGKISVKDSIPFNCKITVSDFAGRNSSVNFILKGSGKTDITKDSGSVIAYPNSTNSVPFESGSITIPIGALYDTLYTDLKECSHPSFTGRAVSIASPETPLQKNIEVNFTLTETQLSNPDKWYVASLTDSKPFYISSEREGKIITGKTSQFGCYGLMADSVPPEIKLISNHPDNIIHDTDYVRVKIRDLQTGIASYRLEINGSWALADYDAKSDLLSFIPDKNTPKGKLDLVWIVTDRRKNSTTFKQTLNRP